MNLSPGPELALVLALTFGVPACIGFYQEINRKLFAPACSKIYWTLRKRLRRGYRRPW